MCAGAKKRSLKPRALVAAAAKGSFGRASFHWTSANRFRIETSAPADRNIAKSELSESLPMLRSATGYFKLKGGYRSVSNRNAYAATRVPQRMTPST